MARDYQEHEYLPNEKSACNVGNHNVKFGRDGTTERILETIEEIGPMTAAEVAQHLGKDSRSIVKLMNDLCQAKPERAQKLYISGFVHDMEGQRKYPRAVYSLGALQSKKKPKRDEAAVKRQYRARMKGRSINSVFALGML